MRFQISDSTEGSRAHYLVSDTPVPIWPPALPVHLTSCTPCTSDLLHSLYIWPPALPVHLTSYTPCTSDFTLLIIFLLLSINLTYTDSWLSKFQSFSIREFDSKNPPISGAPSNMSVPCWFSYTILNFRICAQHVKWKIAVYQLPACTYSTYLQLPSLRWRIFSPSETRGLEMLFCYDPTKRVKIFSFSKTKTSKRISFSVLSVMGECIHFVYISIDFCVS